MCQLSSGSSPKKQAAARQSAAHLPERTAADGCQARPAGRAFRRPSSAPPARAMTPPPPPRPVRKLLIANRGEIACRVARTCRARGTATVAVFATPDAGARHVTECDEAVCIGGPSAYLDAEAIVRAAIDTGADAVHPGYGFLSENAAFAERCAAAGLTFVGPTPEAIGAMGDKIQAKRILSSSDYGKDVPLIPDYRGDDQDDAALEREALRMGFPVLLKAAAGGGGRGMRIVRSAEGLREAISSAKAEGLSAFGDARLLIERYFDGAKHVEVQIFGDRHGAVSHVFERECSVQRRHQKVVEEAPCAVLSDSVRARLYKAAEAIARAIGYSSAGTVEFLLDTAKVDAQGFPTDFFFLEVNTRLQVEHPVTELIAGMDLVEAQLRVAEGATLNELGLPPRGPPKGYAIECRLCAEDPSDNFGPRVGKVALWRPGRGGRVDTGFLHGSEVSVHYDSMIAKLIVHGATRAEAINRMLALLHDTAVLGVTTNRLFLMQCVNHPEFRSAKFTTRFIGDHFPDGTRDGAMRVATQPAQVEAALFAACAWDWHKAAKLRATSRLRGVPGGWRNGASYAPLRRLYEAPSGDGSELVAIEYELQNDGIGKPPVFRMRTLPGGVAAPTGPTTAWRPVELVSVAAPAAAGAHPAGRDDAGHGEAVIAVNGLRQRYAFAEGAKGELLCHAPLLGSLTLPRRARPLEVAATNLEADRGYLAQMPAKILKVMVADGTAVNEGDAILAIESMKMESKIVARAAGVVKLNVSEGELVEAGSVLLTID